jgi:hypothetical protein
MAAFCEGTGSVMNDGFGGLPKWCSLFLFESWVLDTPIKYGFALLGTFAMAILSEVVRVWRVRWEKAYDDSVQKDVLLSIVYGLHMLNAYFLMLLIMLYDSFFLTAIITGLSVGHLIARRMQQSGRRRDYEVIPDAKTINQTQFNIRNDEL